MADLNNINEEIKKIMTELSDGTSKKNISDTYEKELEKLKNSLTPEQRTQLERKIEINEKIDEVFFYYNPLMQEVLEILIWKISKICASAEHPWARQAILLSVISECILNTEKLAIHYKKINNNQNDFPAA